MEIQAIYENGKLTLPAHIKLKHDRVALKVTIPDDEISTHTAASRPHAESGTLQQELNNLLGAAALERPDVSQQEDRDTFTTIMEERTGHNGK